MDGLNDSEELTDIDVVKASLTDKQRRFYDSYMDHYNLKIAMSCAKIKAKKAPKKFYVYVLVGSKDHVVFYVGKGKNKRSGQHLRNFMNNREPNMYKASEMRRIIMDGGKVKDVVLFDNLSEAEAFRIEKAFIFLFPDLTNQTKGTRHPLEKLLLEYRYFKDTMCDRDWIVQNRYMECRGGERIDRLYYYDLMCAEADNQIARLEFALHGKAPCFSVPALKKYQNKSR